MPILYENLSKSQADLSSLILSSAGIPFRLMKGKYGHNVWVNDEVYHRALQSMQAYFKENKEVLLIPHKNIPPAEGSVVSSIIAAMILFICHVGILQFNMEDSVIHRFGSSADRIMRGDLYRGITALMIHSDALHLAGNMVGIIIFGTAVCAVCGYGVGWLMILLSGAFGNLINAFMYESGHISIGASTAVFGAIGILSGYQLINSQRFIKRGYMSWAPLACGLALLGLLGSGTHSDIAAHFFGFAAGIAMGLIYAAFNCSPHKKKYQIVSAFSACFIIVIAWIAGWRTTI